jgi:esterase/lipase
MRKMRILYLHGLESQAHCEKCKWLESQGHSVHSPKINYQEDNCYDKVYKLSRYNNYDVIIGSSMGGWFAWNLGKDMGVPVLLLNPAVHSRSIDPEIEPIRESKPSKVFLAVGLADDVIDAAETIQWLNDHDKLDWNSNNTYKAIYGHRTNVERFIDIWGHFEKNIKQTNELYERLL